MIRKLPKRDPKSQYASIRYQIGDKTNYFYVTQKISNFYIYSINETSKIISGGFKERYTISVITDDDVVVDWITIKNPSNFEVQHELKSLI